MAWMMMGSPSAPAEVPDGTPRSRPGPPPAGVPEYTTWLKRNIAAYSALAKTLVQHRAEKGRIVEAVVKSALRAVLPGKFSLGTGFVITSAGKTSPQLDIVIYDAISNVPVILESEAGLFPIECVYGFIEVKSVLNLDSIDKSATQISAIRNLAKDKVYVRYGTQRDMSGNLVTGEFEFVDALAPRGFLFALDSSYADIGTVELKLREATERESAHVHGLAVLEKDWFLSQRPFTTPHEFDAETGRALEAFCGAVLHSIQTLPMYTASMSRYWGLW